jgi:SAM-dependent methyltransferase
VNQPDRPLVRTQLDTSDLRSAWEEHAEEWVAWARAPGHDSYWQFHRDVFLELVPPPGRRTLDLGSGEGRLSRHLDSLGHEVVAVDASPAMVLAAKDDSPGIGVVRADAARLPFAEDSFDAVVAFMSVQDVDDYRGAISEAARVLSPGGCFCMAVVHPMNSAGTFDGLEADSSFTITGSYLDPSYYADNIVRDDLEMTFVSAHRPLSAYADALFEAGFLIETIREPAVPDEAITKPRSARWQRIPLFLHIRAVKP